MSSDEEDSSDNSDNESLHSESTTHSNSHGQVEFKPDRHLYNAIAYHVYKDYSCKLERQDDGGRNRNKFYFIQLLQKGRNFFVHSRWGKKGHGGQQRLSAPFEDVQQAILLFNKRFKDKTNVDWDNRDHLNEYKGMYMIYKNDPSLSSLKQSNQHKTKESTHDENEEEGPIEKCEEILKTACYEVNVLRSTNADDITNELGEQLAGACPQAFGKKRPSLDGNSGIKEAYAMLNEYKKKHMNVH